MDKVYVKTDAQGRITAVNSSVFLKSTDGWTQIDEGDGDKYRHAQNNYLDKRLMKDGVHQYKLVNGKAVECAKAEMLAEVAALPPPELSIAERRWTALAAALESDMPLKDIAKELKKLGVK